MIGEDIFGIWLTPHSWPSGWWRKAVLVGRAKWKPKGFPLPPRIINKRNTASPGEFQKLMSSQKTWENKGMEMPLLSPLNLPVWPVQKANLFYRVTSEYCKAHEEVISVSAAVQDMASSLNITNRALASVMHPLVWQILRLWASLQRLPGAACYSWPGWQYTISLASVSHPLFCTAHHTDPMYWWHCKWTWWTESDKYCRCISETGSVGEMKPILAAKWCIS